MTSISFHGAGAMIVKLKFEYKYKIFNLAHLPGLILAHDFLRYNSGNITITLCN
jgi:hypothetical protein